MVRPSDASTVAGMLSENVVRYQETPGRESAWGSDTEVKAWSANPGRCQPERSPKSPPLFSGPRRDAPTTQETKEIRHSGAPCRHLTLEPTGRVIDRDDEKPIEL